MICSVFFTVVTDNNKTIEVRFEGILPDLFREGQGIVATGSISSSCKRWTCKNTFLATEVLAKHDENYMPPEVAEALKNTLATLRMKKLIPLTIICRYCCLSYISALTLISNKLPSPFIGKNIS